MVKKRGWCWKNDNLSRMIMHIIVQTIVSLKVEVGNVLLGKIDDCYQVISYQEDSVI